MNVDAKVVLKNPPAAPGEQRPERVDLGFHSFSVLPVAGDLVNIDHVVYRVETRYIATDADRDGDAPVFLFVRRQEDPAPVPLVPSNEAKRLSAVVVSETESYLAKAEEGMGWSFDITQATRFDVVTAFNIATAKTLQNGWTYSVKIFPVGAE